MRGAVALSLADICRDRISKIILSEANLDSGGGFVSKTIVKDTIQNFIDVGFQNLINRSQMKSNEMWASSMSVSSPKAVYLISKSAFE